MTIGRIAVTPHELMEGSAAFNRTAGEVDGSHQTLKTRIDTLTSEGWTGAASTSFQQLYAKFNKSAKDLSDATRGIGTLLEHAADLYRDGEQALVNTFRTS